MMSNTDSGRSVCRESEVSVDAHVVHQREPRFQRNGELEQFLNRLNSCLSLAENEALMQCSKPQPLIFIVGAPRSGTTLLMQWLAASNQIGFPSNLISRFYKAPIIGAQMQRLLTDPALQFRDELSFGGPSGGYLSENGKTSGLQSPNEFWYFWRRFFGDDDCPTVSSLSDDARDLMQRETRGLAAALRKPTAFKAMLFNESIPALACLFPDAVFVHMKRNVVDNASSLLNARRRQFNDPNIWYSFKDSGYHKYREKLPEEQVVHQVMSINDHVSKGLSEIDEKRKLVLHYDELCDVPCQFFDRLRVNLLDLGCVVGEHPDKGHHFFPTKASAVNAEALNAIASRIAYECVYAG